MDSDRLHQYASHRKQADCAPARPTDPIAIVQVACDCLNMGDVLVDTHKMVDVVSGGRSLFDGTQELHRYECSRNPSQVYCLGN